MLSRILFPGTSHALASFSYSSTPCACSTLNGFPCHTHALALFSCLSTSCAHSTLYGFSFYVLFARLRLFLWSSTSCAPPHFMNFLSSSSTPHSSPIRGPALPVPLHTLCISFPPRALHAFLLPNVSTFFTRFFLMTLLLLSPFLFSFYLSPLEHMLIHACCRFPLPLRGLRLAHWILQNSIVLALFYLPISHGSSSRASLVSF